MRKTKAANGKTSKNRSGKTGKTRAAAAAADDDDDDDARRKSAQASLAQAQGGDGSCQVPSGALRREREGGEIAGGVVSLGC